MILVDANIIFYAEDELSPMHKLAKKWWYTQLSSQHTVGLAWITCLAYIRIFTNPRVVEKALSINEAISTVDSWFAQPNTKIVTPGGYFWSIFQDTLRQGQAMSNLSSDAYLAALALENDCKLYSVDADFSRFPGLNWENPLQ